MRYRKQGGRRAIEAVWRAQVVLCHEAEGLVACASAAILDDKMQVSETLLAEQLLMNSGVTEGQCLMARTILGGVMSVESVAEELMKSVYGSTGDAPRDFILTCLGPS